MRYAVFSDIHGNLEAWNKVLADIKELEADVLVCLGDVVGYGPKPNEVLAAIREATDNFVLGNHDAAAVGVIDKDWFNPHARSVLEWTQEQMTEESLEFLRTVPLTMESENLFFVHAEIEEPGRFGYIVNEEDAARHFVDLEHFVTFVGHTHHPLIFAKSPADTISTLDDSDRMLDPTQKYIVNVGSVGEPRNPEDIRARYVIYDSDTREVFFRRIDFDYEAYRRDLLSTTLTVTPFFLQAVDQQGSAAVEDVAAMTVDMETKNLDYLRNFQAPKVRKLHVPTSARRRRRKPKPRPQVIEKEIPWGWIFILLACLAAAAAGLLWPKIFGEKNEAESGRPPAELAVVEEPEAPEPADGDETPAPEPEPEPAVSTTTASLPARYVRIGYEGLNRDLKISEIEVFNNGQNIAVGCQTVLSTGVPEMPARLACDGEKAGKAAVTSNQQNPWLELDLGRTTEIDKLVVWHPNDRDAMTLTLIDENRLAIWKSEIAAVSGQDVKFLLSARKTGADQELVEGPPRSEVSFPALLPENERPVGRFVRVYLPREGVLSLREVQIFSAGKNVVADGTLKMSSVKPGSSADLATDGILENNRNATTNEDGENEPWWEVDLGSEMRIDAIVVWNRDDNYKGRLRDFRVRVAAADGTVLSDDPGPALSEWALEIIPGTTKMAVAANQTNENAETAAWWRLEPNSERETLADANEVHTLKTIRSGKPMGPIAPNPIPSTQDPNEGAVAAGIWAEPLPAGKFELSRDRSFTFEGWFLTAPLQRPVFLAGTRTGDANDKQGWHVDLRPKSQRFPNGQMCFFYDNGAKVFQALSENARFADLKPHHFAAVWDHESAQMKLMLDSVQIASVAVPIQSIPEKQANPFRVGAETNPARFGLDELRFTPRILSRDEWLNAYPAVEVAIQDASFETKTVSEGNHDLPEDGPWEMDAPTKHHVARPNSESVDRKPFGNQMIDLRDGMKFSQELSEAKPNSTYKLTVQLANCKSRSNPIKELKVRLTAGGKIVISDRITPQEEFGSFKEFSLEGRTDEEASGPLRIRFEAIGDSDQRSFLDNIQLTRQGAP